MSVVVRVPAQLRSLTGGVGEVKVEASGSLKDTLDEMFLKYPDLKARILDDSGALRRFVNIFVSDEDIRFQEGLDTKVSDGQVISIVPAVAGG